jgi:GxxExxY protein
MEQSAEATNELTGQIIEAAIAVHRELGPGLLESVYEESLCYELNVLNLTFKRQFDLPIFYKGNALKSHLRLDVIVERTVIVELKSIDRLLPIHQAQLLTYLKLANLHVGLLINFNEPVLKNGIRRIVNKFQELET